jgi:beta-glucosidase
MNRRTLLGAAGALLAAQTAQTAQAATRDGATAATKSFPKGFMWGAATAGHQVEGNNVNSDCWVMENVKPTIFAQPSGDADNSFALWPVDLDLVKALGLNTYRFSLEWARIEPERGQWSIAMLDHYKQMIEGCQARGITPMVTFNHYTTPRWFAAAGGWTAPDSADHFTRFCDRAARHLSAGIGYATTLNEPNIMRILRFVLPKPVLDGQRAMLDAAARACGSTKFVAGNAVNPEDVDVMTRNLLAGHKAGRLAIKSVRPDLPVGVSLSMFDDEAVGPDSRRDKVRDELYGAWLEAVHGDDFFGVQNYERVRWDANGKLPTPANAIKNYMGAEVYAPSLANCVRYAYKSTGVPIIVSEHGVGTPDDRIRANLIPAALAELKLAMDEGVPVKGYVHWSLMDNFEWISGYGAQLGLCSVDRTTFKRTPKPSAGVYAAIARANSL